MVKSRAVIGYSYVRLNNEFTIKMTGYWPHSFFPCLFVCLFVICLKLKFWQLFS